MLSVMMKFAHFFLLIGAILVAGCAHSGTQMSKFAVVRAAKQAAEKAGYKLADYQPPKAHIEYTNHDRMWTVFFELKPPGLPGGHFLVWIDDRTGHATVMPGE